MAGLWLESLFSSPNSYWYRWNILSYSVEFPSFVLRAELR